VTKKSCEEIPDLLVDYADGELSEPDSREVAEHLTECAGCRRLLKSLERSLGLARTIWLDNLEAGQLGDSGMVPYKPAVGWLRRAAVAAVILVGAGSALLWCMRAKSPPPAVTYAQIEQRVTQTAAAAKLLAATQLLAKCEGMESIVEQQAQYILSHYPDTPAASELKATMSAILKGAQYD
jgi:anti-sigma factor RsiW